MPRATRVSYPEAYHHVTNRCNHQERLLHAEDFQDLCALLLEMRRRSGIRLFAYALLQNHYHLLLQESSSGTLSEAMHWFNGSAAARYNIRHKIRGHLWQGRFKNRPIQDEPYFLQCLVYIDLNPARAGLAPNLIDWAFSSTKAHIERIPDPLLDPTPIELNGYKELLSVEWERTQRLQNFLREGDKEAIKDWLSKAPSRLFIPFAREISHLIGSHFRRFIPKQTLLSQKVSGTF